MNKDEGMPEVWQHPHTGEVLISPQLINEVKDGMDSARDALHDRVLKLLNDVSAETGIRGDYLAAAIMEIGITHGVAAWGEEPVSDKLRLKIEEDSNILNAVVNVGSSLALDRVVRERLGEQSDEA